MLSFAQLCTSLLFYDFDDNFVKVSLLLAIVLAILFHTSHGQKGGAKNAMRGRGKSRGGGGGSRGGGGNRPGAESDGGRPGVSGNSDRPRACIGLCYLR